MIAWAPSDNVIALPQGKSNEWYTPASIIESARWVMGSIDLDPASSAIANKIVKASKYYTKEDNGLAYLWYGNVWLNPPFGRRLFNYNVSTIGMFAEKLFNEYEAGSVAQAILLATSRTDTPWFKRAWNYPICFADHLVHFKRPKEEQTAKNPDGSHTHGTCFVYLGKNEQKFIEVFSQFGRIARAIDTPRQTHRPLTLWEIS
jgi:DNA N-6-adenine-methyltransferase (Dam)